MVTGILKNISGQSPIEAITTSPGQQNSRKYKNYFCFQNTQLQGNKNYIDRQSTSPHQNHDAPVKT